MTPTQSQLKRAAAHVMYLQSEISKMRHHASVRQQLTDSIKMLKQQHASTQKVDMHLAQFVRNYKLLLSTIQTASKLVRLNGVSATNEAVLAEALTHAADCAGELVPKTLSLDELQEAIAVAEREGDQIAVMVKSIHQQLARANVIADHAMIALSRKAQDAELAVTIPGIFD
ncbi:hypothetical protein HK105_203776 [Polyrhizophydium stewartii]|uniref:Uncharacterized protein n=1 Tax=Polyrhizophydium stewartii TaxID=2732419 RepID=A0ABR4NAW0_9FUNG